MSAEEDARSQLSAATGERGLDWIGSDWRGRLAEREEGGGAHAWRACPQGEEGSRDLGQRDEQRAGEFRVLSFCQRFAALVPLAAAAQRGEGRARRPAVRAPRTRARSSGRAAPGRRQAGRRETICRSGAGQYINNS